MVPLDQPSFLHSSLPLFSRFSLASSPFAAGWFGSCFICRFFSALCTLRNSLQIRSMSPTCEGGSRPFAIVLHDTAQPIALSFRFRQNYNTLYLHTLNFHFSLSLYFHFRKCRKTFFRFKRFSLIYRDVTLSICKCAGTRYVDTNTLVSAYVVTILV